MNIKDFTTTLLFFDLEKMKVMTFKPQKSFSFVESRHEIME